jgi:serine/threonine-protein kinase
MPRTEEEVRDLLHEMYTTGEEVDWGLTPEQIRTQRSQRRVSLPETKVLVLVAAVVALVVAGLFIGNGFQSHRTTASGPGTTTSPSVPGHFVVVPNEVGKSLTEATRMLHQAGLIPRPEYTGSTAPSGTVLSQAPFSKATVIRDSVVSLVVSTGSVAPSPVAVPNLIGMTQAEAGNTLGVAGLSVGSVSKAPSSQFAVGVVTGELPVAGSRVAPGSSVDMRISTGP